MRTFTLDDVEETLAKEWIALHSKVECPKGYDTHVFASTEEQCTPMSTFVYMFTPTGLGPDIKIKCDLCGRVSPTIFNPEVDW